ncbi:uncharacterized protein LOC111395034 [Olea europaea var. sylvestris]|uniref:uncharacterized protein LOC111395034 n=1 Tax=Olea europaea var. sylvestris TaxID=158386 RepID=UPI000C1D8853|nr:uncharacterized protein LOC111395034 [Olea europaea var. sylvestris]
MSNIHQNSNSTDPTHPCSPYYIGGNDNSGAILVTHVLDNTNYYAWARSIKRALRIKNKLGFIDGSLCEPADSNSFLMEHWLRCSDIVIAWLQNTVSVDIKSHTLYADTACQLWLDLEHQLGQQNAPRIYEVKQSIATLMQNEDIVSVYFSKYKTLLDELMNCESIPNCTCGGFKSVIENQQRDWSFPTLNEVYSIVQQEEKRRQISSDTSVPDSMVFATRGNCHNSTRPNVMGQRKYYCAFCKVPGHSLERCTKANPNKSTYSHCHMTGHSVDKCYKVHGYPPWTQGQGDANKHNQVTFTQEQHAQLLALLQNSKCLPSTTPADTHASKLPGISSCLSAYDIKPSIGKNPNIPWIIDIGATDHMVCCTAFFSNIQAKVSFSVSLPNGDLVNVTHIGIVKQSQVSPSALTETLTLIPNRTSMSASILSNNKDFDLWHYRLGHPSQSRLDLLNIK